MYMLRARVIEGSIPMPNVSDKPIYKSLDIDNFEIAAAYNKVSFWKLYEIGKRAWEENTLSKYEILAWDGGTTNHDGDRFLWILRPDKYNFEHIPSFILEDFDELKPQPLSPYMRHYYDRMWRPLNFVFSLSSYEQHISEAAESSLTRKIC